MGKIKYVDKISTGLLLAQIKYIYVLIFWGAFWIGPLQAAPSLCSEASLIGKPLVWKWFFILMRMELVLKVRVFGTGKWAISQNTDSHDLTESVLTVWDFEKTIRLMTYK